MNGLETSLYELTRLFLLPVLLLILAALAYAFVALGGFAMEAWQRRRGRYRSRLAAWQAQHGGNSDDPSCGSCSAWNGCGSPRAARRCSAWWRP